MSCTIVLDQWVNPIQDLGSCDGPEINSRSVLTTMNKALRANRSADQPSVSHRMIGLKYLTHSGGISGLRIEQSDSDQDDVQLVIRDTW